MRFLRRILYLLKARRHARELNEEMETHRAMIEAEQVAGGLSGRTARTASRRAMGNFARAGEDAREVWIVPWIESVGQDLRYAARSLKSQPGFTAMALAALVLGIGLNTSLFTVINGLMFRGWDVPEANRMVRIHTRVRTLGASGVVVLGAQVLQRESRTMESMFVERSMTMRVDEQTRARDVDFVSGSYFTSLRIGMVLGQGFSEQDDTRADPKAVAVLSHRLWKAEYASDPAIIGRPVKLDDIPYTVVGVAPEKFEGAALRNADIWVPLQSMWLARPGDPFVRNLLTAPGWCCSDLSGRLAPGATVAQAETELNLLYSQFLKDTKQDPVRIELDSTAVMGRDDRQEMRGVIWMVVGGVASILLLACANVSNLLLARAAARRQEMGIRVAIGAGRWRVVRQLLTESLLLAGIASGCGLWLAYWLPEVVLRVLDAPDLPPLTPDGRVVAYSAGISFVTALLFGLAPALNGSQTQSIQAGRRSTARSSLRGLLLGVQVTISVVLLVGAGLLVRAIQHVHGADLGFRTEGLSAVSAVLPSNRYTAERQQAFYRDWKDRLTAANEGRAVALSVLTPLGQSTSSTDFHLPGQNPEKRSNAMAQWVSPGYFDLLRIPILEGRSFTDRDQPGDAIVINETLARLFWPDQYPKWSPVGQAVKIGNSSPVVVGIVRDSNVYGIGPVRPTYFAPFTADLHWASPVAIVPSALAGSAVSIARQMEPLAVTRAATLTEELDRAIGGTRAGARAAGGLGLLALLLATVGVYGVISYSVEQRRKEIGIRMALGARTAEVVGLVLRRNSRAVAVGLIAGLLIAVGASGMLESELYGVSRLDPVTYLGVLAVLLLAAAAASIAPAWRAARTDAAEVLHAD